MGVGFLKVEDRSRRVALTELTFTVREYPCRSEDLYLSRDSSEDLRHPLEGSRLSSLFVAR